MTETSNRNGASALLLITLTIIWGTSFILMKKGLRAFSPGEVGAIRVVSASLFLLPFALTKLKELQLPHYWKLLTSGLLGIFFPAFLFATAQTNMDSAITGILNSLTPIFTLIIGAMLFHQHFKARSIIGILIGLSGTILLILSGTGRQIGGINSYALFVIAACICYGSNVNFIKFKITDLKSLTITSVSLLLIGPLAIIYLLSLTPFTSRFSGQQEGVWEAFGYIVLLGLMSTSVATFLFNRLIKISTPLFASSITYLIPLVAVIWGILDGEKLVAGHLAGMAAIIGGVYLANKK